MQRFRGNWGFAALMLLLFGCGESKPHPLAAKTIPVNGHVVDHKGMPVSQGMVEFRSPSDPEQRATGVVGTDGSFSLSMIVQSQKIAGALPGEYEVTFIPFSQDQVTGDQNNFPKTLKQKYVLPAGGHDDLRVMLEK